MALAAQRQVVAPAASSRVKAFAPSRVSRSRAAVVVRAEAQSEDGLNRRALLSAGLAAAAVTALPLSAPAPARANKLLSTDWELVELPVSKGTVLLDIGFTDDKHGFLLGTRQTLLETSDGGKTWKSRSIEAAGDEGFNYRFNSISFNGNEGWIVGKPAILLHSNDAGASWERIPLSSKLPGVPVRITALSGKAGQAEMITDQGAIYVTDNTAYTWTAAVQETVDATLNRTVSSGISGASYYEGTFSNLARSSAGDYVAVSSRGNFYMTWSPGQTYWSPHNRPSTRRLQNMGFTPEGAVWATTRGGDVLVAQDSNLASDNFKDVAINSRGFGILDVGFRDDKIAFACGGSGSLYRSDDGGKNWKRDRSTDDVAGNLYAVKFFNPSLGFVLGNDGLLLRYAGINA